MAEDRYTALTSGLRRSTGTQSGLQTHKTYDGLTIESKLTEKGRKHYEYLQSEFVKLKQPTFRDTVLEIPNNMELGEFIREWINENPENGLNIKYLNTNKK